MPRTFKFSFPLPRRKSSSEKQPGSPPQRMYSDDADDFPMYSPGIKAEKVLGTSDQTNMDLLEQPPWRPKGLRKHLSFISVTISDAGSDSVKDPDDELLSSRSVSADRAHSRPSIVRNQLSSPVLRQSLTTAVEDLKSSSEVSIHQAHYSPSSSTLRSYYDPAKSPLSISQQTSASSARDMALRKGCPPISSPLARHSVEEHFEVEVGQEVGPEKVDAQKERPRHVDLSALLPQKKPFDPPVHSPHLFAKSPPSPSLVTRTHRSISEKTKWLGREKRKTKQSNGALEGPRPLEPQHSGQPLSNATASNINKPAHKRFDGIENDDVIASEPEPGIVTMQQSIDTSRTSFKPSRDRKLGSFRIGTRKSSLTNHSQQNVPTQLSTGCCVDQTSIAKEHNPKPLHRDKSLSQSYEIKSSPSIRSQKSVRSSQSNRNTLSGIDLRNQSVLALSSSEDESEESVPVNDRGRPYRIRESIDYTDKGEEVLVLSAERVKSIKPQPVVNLRSKRSSRPTSSDVIPPVPSIPARPFLSPRVSSMKWQEQRNSRASLDSCAKGVDPDWNPSTTGSRTSRSSRASSQRKRNDRESRMMAVTPDEEKLLEGMRRKRASIGHDSTVGGSRDDSRFYNVRDSVMTRPKTAGVDTRPGCFDANAPQPPTVSEDLTKSLGGSCTASADDLTHEIECFPEVPEAPVLLQGQTNSVSSPKKSPSLSCTASDLIPSTPTSRRSPITPPAGLGYLDAYSGTSSMSPSRCIYLPKNKHDRKRPFSSSVVVLDGAEQRAQQLDEEDEITGWAMNRW